MGKVEFILRMAKTLISVEKFWARHYYAKSKAGYNVHYKDPDAYSFCALGAIRRCAWVVFDEVEGRIGDAARLALDVPYVSSVNDYKSHAEVMAMFDDGIKRAAENKW